MTEKSSFTSSRIILTFSLLALFSMALAIRVYDITDLPLDFHPGRQLFSAIKARGMYYQTLSNVPEAQRDFAVQQWKAKVTIEPEIIEHIAVFFYRLMGKEQLWIPRLISALIWVVSGIFVYLLARDLISTNGALLSLAFYLLTPYGIIASRSFQPDPMMVALIAAFWWLLYRWTARQTWKWAILAGLVGGLAILVKFVAAFFVISGALGALLSRFQLRELLRKQQVWVLGVLGVLPGAAWIIYGKLVLGIFDGDMSGRFIPSLLISPSFYIQWQNKVSMVAGGLWVMLGLLGLVIIRGRGERGFLVGIWVGYLAFGLYFNYHISTHDYYSLPLLPIVALSLAPLGERFFAWLAESLSEKGTGSSWARSVFFVVLLYGALSIVWDVRNEMKAVDYRPQVAYWAEVSQVLPDDSAVALTEDYGDRLEYWGWRKAELWPTWGDLNQANLRGNSHDINKLFDQIAARRHYFLVTYMDDFARQPDLQVRLADHPIIAQGDGYIVYDLQHPLESQP